MSQVFILLIQLALPLIVSFAAASYLHAAIHSMLFELCGTEDRARFWSRCAIVAMMGVPLMLVLMVTNSPGCQITDLGCSSLALRQTLAWTAGGILAAVAIITYVVGRYIPKRGKEQEQDRYQY